MTMTMTRGRQGFIDHLKDAPNGVVLSAKEAAELAELLAHAPEREKDSREAWTSVERLLLPFLCREAAKLYPQHFRVTPVSMEFSGKRPFQAGQQRRVMLTQPEDLQETCEAIPAKSL